MKRERCNKQKFVRADIIAPYHAGSALNRFTLTVHAAKLQHFPCFSLPDSRVLPPVSSPPTYVPRPVETPPKI